MNKFVVCPPFIHNTMLGDAAEGAANLQNGHHDGSEHFYEAEHGEYEGGEEEEYLDSELLLRSEERSVVRNFEQAMLAVAISENPEVLKAVRERTLLLAKELKSRGRWNVRENGPRLQKVLQAIQMKLKELRSRDSALILEAPELTKMLRNDPTLHTCDVKMCCRISIGWACVFIFCHVPWLLAVFLVGVNYRNNPPIEILEANHTNPNDLVDACNAVASYMLGFFIIYSIIIGIGLIAGIAQTVDESNNICTRYCPNTIAFTSLVLVCYNFYGVIAVWNETLWSNDASQQCVSLRILCVAVLAFFFLLPVICFTIIRIRGGRVMRRMENANTTEEHPIKSTPELEV